MREWFQEVFHLFLFVISIGFGYFFQPAHSLKGDKRSVVLVPGLLGRGWEFYKLKQALVKAGHPVYIPQLGFQAGDIQKKPEQLNAFLRTHELDDFYMVGYSLGGWVAQGIAPELKKKAYCWMTIAVAYEGTYMARCLIFLKAAQQLNWQSPFVRKAALKQAPQHPRHINLFASADEVTVPLKTCHLNGVYRQHKIPVIGHLNLVLHQKSLEYIMQCFAREEILGESPIEIQIMALNAV